MNVQRGDVVLVDYPFAVGSEIKVRPALIVQRLATTIIVQISGNTSRAAQEPTQVLVDIATADGQLSGLHKSSVVNCVNVFTMDRNDVLRRLGSLSPALLQQVEAALKAALVLP